MVEDERSRVPPRTAASRRLSRVEPAQASLDAAKDQRVIGAVVTFNPRSRLSGSGAGFDCRRAAFAGHDAAARPQGLSLRAHLRRERGAEAGGG